MRLLPVVVGAFVVIAVVVAGVVICPEPLPESAPDSAVCEKPWPVRMMFVGDLMCHGPQVEAAKRGAKYDFSRTFEYVRPIFDRADIVVANLETTLSEEPPYHGYPAFRSPAEYADAMADAGIDIALFANNHTLDQGSDGVCNTLEILDGRKIKHVGAGIDSLPANPLFVECNNMRIAILNYTYGTNGNRVPEEVNIGLIDTLVIAGDIERCAAADCTIACLHWGVEYARRENKEQCDLVGFLRSKGVNIIIGSHPHVVQPIECSEERVVVYSLGNFVSNQRDRYCDGGIIAQVDIMPCGDSLIYAAKIIPTWVRLPDYSVIPQGVGDTLPMSAADRVLYERAMADAQAQKIKR